MCCGFSEVNDFTTLMISIIIVIVIAILKPCADLSPRSAFTMITKWIKNREIWNSVIRGFIKLIEKNCVRKDYSKIQRTKTTGLRQNTSIGSPVLTSNKRSLTLSSMFVFWCWSCTNTVTPPFLWSKPLKRNKAHTKMDFLHTLLSLIAFSFLGIFLVFCFIMLTIIIGKSIGDPDYAPVKGTVFNQLLYFNTLHDYQAQLAKTNPTFRLLAPDQSELYTADPRNVEHIQVEAAKEACKFWILHKGS